MNVLVACEFSAIVRDAFRAEGHNAWSVDILPTEGNSEWHIQNDVRNLILDSWHFDLMIAHPPCTYLTNAGVRHLHSIPSRNGKLPAIHGKERFDLMQEAAEFFNWLKALPIERIAIENPIPHHYARDLIGNYSQIVQPWYFGSFERKAICLWLKNLPLLQPSKPIPYEDTWAYAHRMTPSKNRWMERSRFFPEVAAAMASQWSNLN